MEHEPEKHSTSIIDKSKDMVATTVHVAQDVYQQVQDTLYQQQEQGASLPRRAFVAGATVLAVATEKVHEAGIPTAGVENVAHRLQQMTMLEQQREATKQAEEQKTGGLVSSVIGKVPIIGSRFLKGKTPEPQETTTSPRIEPVSVKSFEIPEHDQAEAGESLEQREHVIPQQIPGGHEEEVAKIRPLSQESGMDVGTKERMQQQHVKQPPPSHLSEDIKLQRLRESEPSRQPLQVQREHGTMTGTESHPPFESITSVTSASVMIPITQYPSLEMEEIKQGVRPQQDKKPSFWKKLKNEMKASVNEIRSLVSESPPPGPPSGTTRETTSRHATQEYQRDPRI